MVAWADDFPRVLGEGSHSIQLNKPTTSYGTSCPAVEIREEVRDALLSQHGVDWRQFHLVEYALPEANYLTECKWGGAANTCRMKNGREAGLCHAYIRVSSTVRRGTFGLDGGRFHEFGHNQGLPDQTSGLKDSPMSGGAPVYYSATERLILDALPPSSTLYHTQGTVSRHVELLDLPIKASNNGKYSAYIIQDPTLPGLFRDDLGVVIGAPGKQRVLSYRAGVVGYDANLRDHLKRKVYVQTLEDSRHTHYHTALETNGFYTTNMLDIDSGASIAVQVCSINDTSARVAIGTTPNCLSENVPDAHPPSPSPPILTHGFTVRHEGKLCRSPRTTLLSSWKSLWQCVAAAVETGCTTINAASGEYSGNWDCRCCDSGADNVSPDHKWTVYNIVDINSIPSPSPSPPSPTCSLSACAGCTP